MGPIGFAGVFSLPYDELGGLWHLKFFTLSLISWKGGITNFQHTNSWKCSKRHGALDPWFFCAEDVPNCTAWRSMTYVWPMDICQLLAGTSSKQHYVSKKEACLPGMMTAFIVIAFDNFCLDLRTSEFSGSCPSFVQVHPNAYVSPW